MMQNDLIIHRRLSAGRAGMIASKGIVCYNEVQAIIVQAPGLRDWGEKLMPLPSEYIGHADWKKEKHMPAIECPDQEEK